ncbi:MAG: molybdopterin-dependent oxidoreductase [Acidimicrobiales bacterium]
MPSSYGKSSEGFVLRSAGSLEPDTMDLGEVETPVDRFFVCSAGDAPSIDRDVWRLRVDGDAVNRPVELEIADLENLTAHEIPAWLECAGNGRQLYSLVDGHEINSIDSHTPWLLGGMGAARWSGPRLADVLTVAGLVETARWVSPAGLDVDNSEGEPVRMCLPIEKALDQDTILATHMNGAPLAAAHGSPVRLLVPGWMGAYSVKWLGRIEVSSAWVPSWRADTYYRLRDPEGTDLGPATAHPVKSSLAVEWGGDVPAGGCELRGYARSGTGRVVSVEWSIDGDVWHPAQLAPSAGRWSWTPFRFYVELTAGEHRIRTRATDESGASQPDSVPFHPNGILWNAVTPHPVVAN